MSTIVTTSTSHRKIEVTHVVLKTTKPFGDVKAALEDLLPEIDESILRLLREAKIDELKEKLEGGPELLIIRKRNHVVPMDGEPRHAVQYEIGNPLTASTITRRQIASELYAPLRVILYENDNGGCSFEYDLPSSLFGQFNDERVTEIERGVDDALGRALSIAAGVRH